MYFTVFFQTWIRVPKVQTATERFASLVNAEDLRHGNFKPEPREPLISLCRMGDNHVIMPEKPAKVNPALEIPEVMAQVMRSMDDGEHAMALRCLRQRNLEGTAAQDKVTETLGSFDGMASDTRVSIAAHCSFITVSTLIGVCKLRIKFI